MAAAKNGDFDGLLGMLAPDVTVAADDAAVLVGTPQQIEGRDEVAAFFNGSAKSALPVFVGEHTARHRLVPSRRLQGRLRLHRQRRPRARHHLPRRARGAFASRAAATAVDRAADPGHTLADSIVSTSSHHIRRR